MVPEAFLILGLHNKPFGQTHHLIIMHEIFMLNNDLFEYPYRFLPWCY